MKVHAMRFHFRRIFVFALLLGFSVLAMADNVRTDYNHQTNFSQYHTYSWGKVRRGGRSSGLASSRPCTSSSRPRDGSFCPRAVLSASSPPTTFTTRKRPRRCTTPSAAAGAAVGDGAAGDGAAD